MAIIKKYSPFQNLSNFQVLVDDINPNSDYFRITSFKETFTGGKNGFLIEGSEFLRETTEIKIEILDVEGNPIYYEPGDGVPEYYEGISKLVSVHVYDDTPIGLGKITILGELKRYVDNNGVVRDIPDEWKGVYNVKWEKRFQINKNLNNEDIVRFYKRPQIQITELIKPIFSKSIPSVTDVVEVTGVPQQPVLDTNLSTWRAGTSYKLIRATGSWDRDVDENQITISSLNYSPTIIEVLNDREVLVDVPYTENNLVKSFISQSASVTYSDFNNQTISDSALTGSFAKIDMSQLKTFVGDVARVKIFRKSRNTAGDFQFVQESKLESTELLRDVTTQSDNEISYGNFTETNLSNYWVTSSNDHLTTIDSSVLSQAVKFDYNETAGGVQKLITSESFTLSKDVEYTLSFKTLLSGSVLSSKNVKAYFSGSYTNNLGQPATYTQSFMHISGSGVYTTRQNVSQNILAERDISAKLVFEVEGADWYISNVSLRNAQETSFSPDEFTLIQDIPRKLASETFDFRFEFYDINNNYIPVDVTATATFDGGNDFPTSGKLLTFESDRNAFRFSTGSIANPYNQTIQFKTTATNLTGSILFESSAFDVDGNYLSPSNYSQYPGLLTNVTTAGALLTLNNFTGSYSGAGDAPYVGSIVYTASLESLQEFETVYRLEDGDNAPSLIVTSNANQFIYEPTSLEPKPSGQSITVRAQRKNLASLITPITVNSGSNLPELNYVGTANGVDTYTISALQFSSSFASNDFDEVTYSFTGSDVFGNEQYDEITLSKVINFDGVSVVLSTENTSFESDSTGTVTGTEFDKGDGTVDVRVGSKVISHSEGLGSKNTFDIVSVTPSTGLTANSTAPTTNSYGISAMSVDSGTLTLLIRYKAGDNSTTIDFTKVVNYSKTKKAAPVLSIETTNKDQSVSAKSTGAQIDSFLDSIVTVKEQYNGSSSTLTLTALTAQASVAGFGSIATTPATGTVGLSGKTMADATNSVKVAISATVTDSEGTSRSLTDNISLSKVKNAAPTVLVIATPQSQNVSANSSGVQTGTLSNVVVSVENGSFVSMTKTQTGFSTNPTISTNTLTMTSAVMNAAEASVTLTVNYTDSEGTSGSQSVIIRCTKTNDGSIGTNGSDAVSIELNPPSQEVIIDIQDNITDPDDFVVNVFDAGGAFSYADPLTDGTFKIGTVTNGTNNEDGTITPDTPSDANGLTVSVPITYKDRDGNTSAEITKTHIIRVVADGSTGPGIVFTGPWDTDRIYQYDISNGRRDAVLYSGTYYATLQQAGTSVGTPDTEPNYWESLGTDDFFVAAKIAIFENSYVQKVLNIGTNSTTTLSSANITLNGTDTYPYFSLGQSADAGTQEYGANGIFIGRHDATKNSDAANGAYVLSISNGTNWMKWNGSTLDIKGNLTIAGESSPLDPTQITNTSDPMGGGTLNYNPNFTIVGSDGRPDGVKAVYGSATTTNISYQDAEKSILKLYNASDTSIGAGFPAFKVNKDASYKIHFRVKSTAANTSGFYFRMYEYDGELPQGITHISNSAGASESGVVEDTRQKSVTVNTGTSVENGPITTSWVDYIVTYTPTSTAIWVSPIFLNWTGMGTSELHVDRIAVMLDTSDKTQGSVGGWSITSSEIQGGSPSGGGNGSFTTQGMRLGATGYISAKEFYISSTGAANFKGSITGGTLDIGGNDSTSFHVDSSGNIWSGAANYADATFKVSSAGVLSATGGTFNGALTATSLTLSAGVTIGTASITGLADVATSGDAADVGLGNVENLNSAGQAQNGIESAITIASGGITMSSGGFIKGGQTAYNTGNGFFLGYSGSKYRFSIGDGSTKGITWDGTTLTIAGDVILGATSLSTVESNANAALTDSSQVDLSQADNTTAGFQDNDSDKTGGSVGGWSTNSTTLKALNNRVVLSNSGYISLTDGTSEKILITKDALTTTSDDTTITFATRADASGTQYPSGYTGLATGGASISSTTVNSGTFTVTAGSVIVSIGYPGTSGIAGSNYWSGTGTGFDWVSWETEQIISAQLRTSSGTLVSTRSTQVFYDLEYGTAAQATTYHYHPEIPSGVGSVVFDGVPAGDYYVSVYWTRNVRSYQRYDSGHAFPYYNQYLTKGSAGAVQTVNTTSAEQKLSIGVNGLIATSPGGFAQIGDIAADTSGDYSGLFLGDVKVNGQLIATSVDTSSDARIKMNIHDLNNPIEIVKNLKPKTFRWNRNKMDNPRFENKDSIGFIAQDVQEVLPQIVRPSGSSKILEDRLLSIDYNALIAVNTSAIKVLLDKIEQLEQKISELENK